MVQGGDGECLEDTRADTGRCCHQELIASTVGPFRSASLSYDSKGQSTGVATIQFQKAADATKAYNQYNKRLIDGSAYSPFLFLPISPFSSRSGVEVDAF
jgi:hypothetical protein